MGKKICVGKGTLFCLFEHFGLNEQVMCCFSPLLFLTLPITMQRCRFRSLVIVADRQSSHRCDTT